MKTKADVKGMTDGQLQALFNVSECSCVISIPGSGKTKTVCEKIVHLLTGHELGLWRKPKSVMAVTFTAEAGRELAERTKKRFGSGSKGIEGRLSTGTFHSIFMKALKRVGAELTERRIGNEGQISQYMDRAIRKCMPSMQDKEMNDKKRGILRGLVERARSNLRDKFGDLSYFGDQEACEGEITAAIAEYRSLMKQARIMDFTMILEESLNFLVKQGEIERGESYQEIKKALDDSLGYEAGHAEELMEFLRADHVIVDEGQDIDALQYSIMMAIANDGIFVDIVGDDDQSIYSFRYGLGYQGMVDFMNDTGASQILLDKNFRCKREILQLAEGVIKQNLKRTDKQLIAHRPPGGETRLHEYTTSGEELTEVARQIKALNETEDKLGAKRSTKAVIARLNSILDEVQYMFGADIEHERVGAKSIWSDSPICFYVALLEGILWNRVGVPMDQCLYWAGAQSRHSEDGEGAICDIEEELRLTINRARGLLKASDNESIAKGIALIHGWFAWVCEKSKWSNGKKARNLGRVRICTRVLAGESTVEMGEVHLADNATKYVVGQGDEVRTGMQGRLEDRLKALAQIDRTGKHDEQAVRVVSMHGSKGLEFDHVWIVGLDNKTIPGVEPDMMEVSRDRLEEECRLLYVAITRARDNVYLSWARTIGRGAGEDGEKKKEEQDRSECLFLAALPSDLRPIDSMKVWSSENLGLTV